MDFMGKGSRKGKVKSGEASYVACVAAGGGEKAHLHEILLDENFLVI